MCVCVLHTCVCVYCTHACVCTAHMRVCVFVCASFSVCMCVMLSQKFLALLKFTENKLPCRQMFLPVLKFLLALLTCPGPQQREASTQVTALIGAHSDLFATILRDHVHHISIATLHELALVTALISRSGIGKCTKQQILLLKNKGAFFL